MSMSLFSVSVIKLVILQCSRCTSSLSETNRATNGHRFVFQSSEVLGTERHYIPNEKGILPFVTTGILNTVQPHTYTTPQLNIYHSDNRDYRADSYGQTPPIDSLSTAPALEFTNILDYSQTFGHDSWTVSCTTLILYHTILIHSFPLHRIEPWPPCISFFISTSHARLPFFYPCS